MSYNESVRTVAEGGTGIGSATAYAVLCGGTTATNPIQSIAGVGTAGQHLTSNGAGALPTFQTQTAKYTILRWGGMAVVSPADSTTYYMGLQVGLNTAQADVSTWSYIPKTGTLIAVYGVVNVQGTLGSNENVTISARLNNTTDVTVTSTSQWTTVTNAFSNSGLSQAVTAGDYLQLKIVTPAWVTNPTNVNISAQYLISYSV